MEEIVQNHYGSGDNVKEKHEHHNHEAPHIIPKVLTQQVGSASKRNFVGRKKELQEINELLKQDSTLLLINGIGGIGKSTLASYYFNQKKDNFDYYGFIKVGEDIKSSLTSALADSLDLKSDKIDDLFSETMNKLLNLEGDKLLVLDDMKNLVSQKDELKIILTLEERGFKIIFTSREIYENIPQYFLDMMNIDDARELFLKYYFTDEIDKIDKIIRCLDYHTLFVEMTAKTLAKRKQTFTLEKIIEKFDNGEFAIIKKDRQESFKQYLNDLFSNDKILKDEEILLFLKKLSTMPSVEISFEDLYKYLTCEDEVKLEELLIELSSNGWLIETKQGYKLHQILKEFILENYMPKFEEIENIIEYFTNFMEGIYSTQDVLDKQNYLIYLESLNKLTKKIKSSNEKVAYLLHSEGYINFVFGNYKKAKKLYDKSLSIRQYTLNENDIQLAISYNGQASVAEKSARYKDALILYQKSLEMREKNIWIEKIVIEYNNIGRMYKKLGKVDEAFKYLSKSLNIRKEIFGEEHESTAKAYNVLGSFFQDIAKDKNNQITNDTYHEKAFEYLNKSLEIRNKIHNSNHPSIATSYNNLATWYSDIEDWDNAIEYLEMLIDNFKGDENREILAQANFNIGQIYLKKENYDEAKKFTQHSLTIWKEIFDNSHQYIQMAEDIMKLINEKNI